MKSIPFLRRFPNLPKTPPLPRELMMRAALGRRLPLTSGSLYIRGPQQSIQIHRDQHGVPYIEAQSDEDAWFGLGFCQGQDRAFQLDLRLRTARGTLSQLVGPRTLAIDRLSRRIGFRESAIRQLPALEPEVRAQVEAFAAGINAGARAGLPQRPHEFTLLRGEPSRWDAADVVAAGKLMSFLLVGNWDVELARLKILMEDGEQALRDLDPAYDAAHPISVSPQTGAGPALDYLSTDVEALIEFTGIGGGSNNWVVSAARTASGRPILANDPHLDPALPPHWYLAHLRTPQWQVAGAALIGAPAFGAGHNQFCAWGITAALSDTADLFIEEIAPDGRGVRRGAGYEACEVRREIIDIKGAAPVIEDVLVTPRGPIISPMFGEELPAIALRAVWLDPLPARGFLTVHKAASLEQFREQFRQWPVLPQNVVYADVEGHIAYQLVGELPRRRKGSGTLPQAGSDPDSGWLQGTVPLEEMPFALNPQDGFLATANNKPAVDGTGPFLGVDWLDGYRVSRILEGLAAEDSWDVQKSLRFQLDQLSMPWRQIRDIVLALEPGTTDGRLGLELLREWDGVVGVDSIAASVYEGFIFEMWNRIARTRAPRSSDYALSRGFTELAPGTTFASGRISTLIRRIIEQPDGWFWRGWPAEMSDALAHAVTRLRREHGEEQSAWAWGSVRPLTLRHPIGRIAALEEIFNRGPFPYGGDGNTVSQAASSIRRFAANPGAIASLRAVMDVGDWDNSRFSLPGGQSGNPLSLHYDDLLPFWLRGEGVPIAWSLEAVRRAMIESLHLAPLG